MAARQSIRRGLAQWITAADCPMFVLDSRGVVLVFNKGCEAWTGVSAAEVIGQRCHFAASPCGSDQGSDRLTILKSLLVAPERSFQEPVLAIERSCPAPDGGLVECLVHFFPLRDGDEPAALRVLGILTPRPVLESPLVTSQAEAHGTLLRLMTEWRQRYQLTGLVALTAVMRRALARGHMALPGFTSVHLQGEPGVGKEHFARCLHQASSLAGLRFLPLDCRNQTHFELKRTLDRAFDPDQESGRPQGTLFLKHVDALARDLQELVLKQLRGPMSARTWRICSSALGNWQVALEQDRTVPELYHELTTAQIELPPLRDRLDDLPMLTQQLLEEGNQDAERPCEAVTPAVLQRFLKYRWPGNVGELKAVLREARSVAGAVIDIPHLPLRFRVGWDAQCQGPPPPHRLPALEEALREREFEILREALALAKGNKSLASEMLGIPRAKLYRRLEAHGLADDREQIETIASGEAFRSANEQAEADSP